MEDYQSQSHVRWECKYHIVWCPKYRQKKLYGKLRRRFGEIRKKCHKVEQRVQQSQEHWETFLDTWLFCEHCRAE